MVSRAWRTVRFGRPSPREAWWAQHDPRAGCSPEGTAGCGAELGNSIGVRDDRDGAGSPTTLGNSFWACEAWLSLPGSALGATAKGGPCCVLPLHAGGIRGRRAPLGHVLALRLHTRSEAKLTSAYLREASSPPGFACGARASPAALCPPLHVTSTASKILCPALKSLLLAK